LSALWTVLRAHIRASDRNTRHNSRSALVLTYTLYRASSSSARTARSSASSAESPSLSSSSARTPARSHGLFCAVARGERVSLRYAPTTTTPDRTHERHNILTTTTGGRQVPPSPRSQVPACHRRCFPRRHQGASRTAPRGPLGCPPGRHQGGQGEAHCRPEREEG
jgi:hypothetical protein